MDDHRKNPPRRGPKSSAEGRGGERPRPSGKAAFGGKPRAGGGKKKPFQALREDTGEVRAERPKRDFKRDDRPRDGGGDRPFRAGGGNKPFRARREDAGEVRAERPS